MLPSSSWPGCLLTAVAECFKGFLPGWLNSANPSWPNVTENGSISPQWHHTTCGHGGGRPTATMDRQWLKKNGQVMEAQCELWSQKWTQTPGGTATTYWKLVFKGPTTLQWPSLEWRPIKKMPSISWWSWHAFHRSTYDKKTPPYSSYLTPTIRLVHTALNHLVYACVAPAPNNLARRLVKLLLSVYRGVLQPRTETRARTRHTDCPASYSTRDPLGSDD